MDLRETNGIAPSVRRHPWERARAKLLWTMLKPWHRRAGAGEFRVLDVGSGDLYQASTLLAKAGNIRVTGLDTEYTPSDIDQATRFFGPSLTVCSSPGGIPARVPFHAVLMMDVIEHVPDDRAFLREWAGSPLTGEDTLFFITVPAHPSLFSHHDEYLGHYRRYSRKSLLSACRDAGIRPLSSGYFFFSLWLARKLQFGLMRVGKVKKKPASDLSEWKGGRFTASLITGALVLDFCLMRLLLRPGIRLTGLSAWVAGVKD